MHIMIRKFFLWKMLTRAARAESTPDTLRYHLRRFNLCPIRIQEACGKFASFDASKCVNIINCDASNFDAAKCVINYHQNVFM